MAEQVLLPQWGMEMQEGTIIKWLKKEGESVEKGEPLAEIETAKLETELESSASGMVARILVPEGDTVPVRAVLAIIAAPGEKVREPSSSQAAEPVLTDPPKTTQASPQVSTSPVQVQVVPLARKLANERGIDLSQVEGTGPGGRILVEDVQRIMEEPASIKGKATPMSTMRQAIARSMVQSLQTMAQVTLTTDVDVTDAIVGAKEFARKVKGGGIGPLPVVIKAVARSLKEHPNMNAVLKGDTIELIDQINIGTAVSLAAGLIVPTIRQADGKSLGQIAQEARGLANKARDGKATHEEITGGTFTVTNLGGYGIDGFTPIINPPQVGILGMGRVQEKPVVYQGDIAKRSIMVLSLTFDHRVVDGAPAADFLRTIKNHLESPAWMLE